MQQAALATYLLLGLIAAESIVVRSCVLAAVCLSAAGKPCAGGHCTGAVCCACSSSQGIAAQHRSVV